jgi:dihydroxyacetone kinase-like protein
MGPLYGVFFDEMSLASGGLDEIGARDFETMLQGALVGIQEIGSAKRGDKTLLDTLIPGVEAYSAALDSGKDFSSALDALQAAAKEGWQSTEGMVAKIGRASRLGERSRGVLDAGATSCYLLLNTMVDSIQSMLK